MSKLKYKKGQKVYSDRYNEKGVIVELRPNRLFPYRIRWKSGHENIYDSSEFETVLKTKKELLNLNKSYPQGSLSRMLQTFKSKTK